MAILKTESKEVVLAEGDSLIEAAKGLGVPFGCHSGLCGICRIEVEEGINNLSPKTEEELILGCTGNVRQACQCKILQGTVKIHF